eukprot:4610321-Amphidinium_carterae.1
MQTFDELRNYKDCFNDIMINIEMQYRGTHRERPKEIEAKLQRDWCKHCVQGKGRQHHHQKGGLLKQTIAQNDYAFLKSDNDRHNATVLMMCESTKGLGYATTVPYKGINQEVTKPMDDYKNDTTKCFSHWYRREAQKLQTSHKNRVCHGRLPEPLSTQPPKRQSTAYRPTWIITLPCYRPHYFRIFEKKLQEKLRTTQQQLSSRRRRI